MAQRRSLANSEIKKTAMDPTSKKHPSSTTTTAPPPHLITSFTPNKTKPNYPKRNSINKASPHPPPTPSTLKSSDLPRVDTHLQAKSLTLSANAGSSLLKKTHHHHHHHHQQQSIKQSTVGMEKQKANKDKEKINLRKTGGGGGEPKLPSVSLVSGGGGSSGRRRSFCDSKIELGDFFSSVGARVVAVDMPPFMQIHAVSCARKAYDSQEKVSSKTLAFTLKKEFDGVYGPAWHCIVGTSFGSFVTHSVAGFLYFSMDHKFYILLFKTTVQRAD